MISLITACFMVLISPSIGIPFLHVGACIYHKLHVWYNFPPSTLSIKQVSAKKHDSNSFLAPAKSESSWRMGILSSSRANVKRDPFVSDLDPVLESFCQPTPAKTGFQLKDLIFVLVLRWVCVQSSDHIFIECILFLYVNVTLFLIHLFMKYKVLIHFKMAYISVSTLMMS